MTIEIKVPALGESVTEATVGQWFKKPGEAVKVDEPLVELETDKVTVEVPAPAAGVLADIKVEQGATVGIGSVLGSIKEGAGAAAKPAASQPAAAAPAAERRPRQPPPKPRAGCGARRQRRHAAVAGRAQDDGGEGSRRRPTCRAPAGAARSSRRTWRPPPPSRRRDSRRRSRKPPRLTPMATAPVPVTQMRAPSVANDAAREERVRMTRLRQTIARRLKDAQNTAAMLTTFNDVDMSAIMKLRNEYKELFEKRHHVKLGFMGFFVKACIQALREVPAVNAEIDGQDIIYKNYYHIGVAVGTERGLVVPVVREADRMSLAEIEQTIADFGRRAREGKLSIEEMQGGTFTITNGGVLRLAAVDADPERAAVGHSRHAPHRGARRRQERPDRGAPDDEPGAQLRPPHRRRPRRRDLPGAREGVPGGPAAVPAGGVGPRSA